MNGYYRQLVALLAQHGFARVRSGKGSHEIWGKDGKTTTVPFNCPSRHTANHILKTLGIKDRF